jgi:hypothetical protein
MTSTDSNEPSADEWDEQLADAIRANQTDETVIENARLVALYFTTLVDNDVPLESATELTCLWVTTMEEA